MGVTLGAFAAVALVAVAYAEGRAVANGTIDGTYDLVSVVCATMFTIGIALVAVRSLRGLVDPIAPELVLTSATHRDVVYSTLLLETSLTFLLVGLPGLFGGLAFAVGGGSPSSAALGTVVVLAIVPIAAGLGFAIGLGIRNAIARSRVLARYRTTAGVLILFGYVGVLFLTDVTNVFEPIVGTLGASPLGWFADVALLAVVPAADPLRAGVILLLSGLAVLGLVASNSRLAAQLWYTTPVDPSPTAGSTSLPKLPGVGPQTGHVVRKTWTRARRSPIRLLHVGYVGLFAGWPLIEALRDGTIAGVTVIPIVLYGAWATGSAFTLNPIGDEGAVLPVTLTSPITGRRFVRALWLAGAVPGVVLTLIASLAIAVGAGFDGGDLALVGVLAAGLPALAPGVASGIGAVFPRTERVDVGWNRRAVVPSYLAFLLYSLTLPLLTVPIWVVIPGTRARVAASIPGLSPAAVGVVATGIALVAVGIAALTSYHVAGKRVDRYTLY